MIWVIAVLVFTIIWLAGWLVAAHLRARAYEALAEESAEECERLRRDRDGWRETYLRRWRGITASSRDQSNPGEWR